MQDVFSNRLRRIKALGTLHDLGIVGGTAYALALILDSFALRPDFFSCETNNLWNDSGLFDRSDKMQPCVLNDAIQMTALFLLPYYALCVAMMRSRLRSTPALWFKGIRLRPLNGGGRPDIDECLRLLLLSPLVVISHLLLVLAAVNNFHFSPHTGFNFIIIDIAGMSVLSYFIRHGRASLTLTEQLSGLAMDLTPKAEADLRKAHTINKTGMIHNLRRRMLSWYPLTDRVAHAACAAFLTLLAFNAVRDFAPVPAFDRMMATERPAITDADNAYNAMLRINESHDPARPHPEPDLPDLTCFIEPGRGLNAGNCPSAVDIDALITGNETLLRRFDSLFSYTAYADPAIYSANNSVDLQLLFRLAQLDTAHTLRLAQRGDTDAAMREWERATNFYRMLVNGGAGLSERMMFVIMLRQQVTVLQPLLHTAPAIAQSHGAAIDAALAIDNIGDIGAYRVFKDDATRIIRVTQAMWGTAATHKRKLAACADAFTQRAALAAPDYFALDKTPLCAGYDYGTFFQGVFTEAGNPGSIVLNNLLFTPVVLHPPGALREFHRVRADMNLARAAIGLMRQSGTLADQPHNPLTGHPFSWDAAKSAIYYDEITPADGRLVPGRSFEIPAP